MMNEREEERNQTHQTMICWFSFELNQSGMKRWDEVDDQEWWWLAFTHPRDSRISFWHNPNHEPRRSRKFFEKCKLVKLKNKKNKSRSTPHSIPPHFTMQFTTTQSQMTVLPRRLTLYGLLGKELVRIRQSRERACVHMYNSQKATKQSVVVVRDLAFLGWWYLQ